LAKIREKWLKKETTCIIVLLSRQNPYTRRFLICDYNSSFEGDIQGERLVDTKNGQRVKWREKKTMSRKLAVCYARLDRPEKSERVNNCAGYLQFKLLSDMEKKLYRAWFCRVHLCPMCAWRKSLKIYGQVSKVMNVVDQEYPEHKYIFLTLTMRNCCADELKNTLDKLFLAFNALTKYKEVAEIAKGWFRALEITHNVKTDEYHPHIHTIILVPGTYAGRNHQYIKQARWTELWQRALGVDYKPLVDVRSVKAGAHDAGDVDGTKRKSAVSEVAKYAVKTDDYIDTVSETVMDGIVSVLDAALHNRRMVAYGGLLRAVHKRLHLDDVETGDLVNTDNDDDIRADLAETIIAYRWVPGLSDYYEVR
jgi:plasmid rolling circle replication initiator protein Rep